MTFRTAIVAGCLILAGMATVTLAQRMEETIFVPYEHDAIKYFETPSDNPVSRLDDKLDKGEAKLDYAPGGLGYLPSLLKQLGIPVDSQTLVYSQSSFQAPLISRERPRAVYFDDNLAVGFVQSGEVFEVSAFDPHQGVVFYTLNTKKVDKPSFGRREVCLQCHQGAQTLGVPGLVVSSQYLPKGIDVEHTRGGFVTDDRTEIADRWGGWYISGSLGGQKHLGIMIPGPAQSKRDEQSAEVQNPSASAAIFDPARYLTPYSDVVALMTLEHQTRMTNLITRIGWDTRIAVAEGKMSEFQSKLDSEIDQMVTYMVFADEAPLKAPVQGASTFSKTFPERGPRDSKGRSLRDFDLRTRLFRYPLTYMIYNPAFDALPEIARNKAYDRLYDVLTGKDTAAKFARLSSEDREAALEIVRDTKPNLPARFRAATAKER
jgi:hypothetical protein